MSVPSIKGLSLVELMIVLVIASIVTAFALPSYRQHLVRARIPDATGSLTTLGMRLEQYYQDHRSYARGAACGVPMPADANFDFRCELRAQGQDYLLAAAGRADSPMAGFAFTLDAAGQERTPSLPADWGGTPRDCWVDRPSAAC